MMMTKTAVLATPSATRCERSRTLLSHPAVHTLISVWCELRRWRILSMLFATNSKPKIKTLAGVLEQKLEAADKEDETEYSGDGLAEWKKSVLNKMEMLHGTKGKPGSWPAYPPIGNGA